MGKRAEPYRESDPPSPLGVYGQTKAAADQVVATVPEHYIVRTSWVIGAGRNFVDTMRALAQRGADPAVIDDQRGRLTFATELARAVRHLLATRPPYGVYNVTGSGPVQSWADIAAQTFSLVGCRPERVTPVSTAEYYASAQGVVAPRPANSTLDLTKIRSTGFEPADSRTLLAQYLRGGTGPTSAARGS